MDAVDNDLFDFVTSTEEPVCYYIGSTLQGYLRIFFNYTEFFKSFDNYDYVICMNEQGIKMRAYAIDWVDREDTFKFRLVSG